MVGINEGDSMWWSSYLRNSNSLKFQNSTQLISILHSNAEFSKLSKILLYSQTFGSHCTRWKYLPQKIHQGFNNVMERVKPQVRGNENSIIINACYWDFLEVSFHCGIFTEWYRPKWKSVFNFGHLIWP